MTKSPKSKISSALIKQLAAILLLVLSLALAAGCERESPEQKYQRLVGEAQTFVEQKKYPEARLKLLGAIDAKPEVADTYFQLAEVYVHLKKLREAFEYYGATINADPNHRQARLRLAALLLAGKRLEDAESHVQKVLEQHPGDKEATVLLANIRASQFNRDEARKLLDSVLERHPDDIPALASLAGLELSVGNTKRGEEILAEISRRDPENSAVQLALVDLYSQQGRLDEAQEILELLVSLNPDEAALHSRFAEFLLRRGVVDSAVEQFKAALHVDAMRHVARDRLFDIYLGRGNREAALELVQDLKNAAPSDPATRYFEAREKEVSGDLNAALEGYIAAIQALPSFGPAFRRAGLVELAQGRRDQAVEHLNQAIAIDPEDVAARLALADDAFRRGNLGRATEHVDTVLATYPHQLAANLLRADISLVRGEKDKARFVYETLRKAFPDNPLGYVKLGILEETEKNIEKAKEHYLAAVKFDRGIDFAIKRYAQLSLQSSGLDNTISTLRYLLESAQRNRPGLLLVLGQLELSRKTPQGDAAARDYFQQSIAANPNFMTGYFALAGLDLREKKFEEAIAAYHKIAEAQPQNIVPLMLVAVAYEQQRDYQKAVEAYRKVLTVQPRFGPAANNLAWLLAEEVQGDLEEALKAAQVAKEQMPKDPHVTDTLGWVYFRRGTARAALPILEDALELARENPDTSTIVPSIQYHLGEAYAAAGEKESAVASLTSALKAGGAGAEFEKRARELLAQLQ